MCRFHELEIEISDRNLRLRDDISDLQDEMADFKWQVQTLLYEAREEDLWQTMLQIENSSDTFYSRLKALGTSRDTLENRKQRSLQLADQILVSPVAAHVADTRLAFMGKTVTPAP